MNENTTYSSPSTARPIADDSTGYDPATGTFHSRFDGDSGSVVVAIVDAVAAVTGREHTALSPLYATVDPEALAELVTTSGDRPINVTFAYEGCQVTVSSDGSVTVDPPEMETEADGDRNRDRTGN